MAPCGTARCRTHATTITAQCRHHRAMSGLRLRRPKEGQGVAAAAPKEEDVGTTAPLEFVGQALLRMHQMDEAFGNVIHGCTLLNRRTTRDELQDILRQRWTTAHPRVRSKVVQHNGRCKLQVVASADLDWAYHVRKADLGANASRQDVYDYIGRLFGEPMDLSKPLWQFVMVESMKDTQGGGEAQAAIISRTHHVLGDGTSLIHLFLSHLVDQPSDGQQAVATPRTRASDASRRKAVVLDTGVLAPLRRVAHRASILVTGTLEGVLSMVLPSDTATFFKPKSVRDSGGPRKLSVARPIPVAQLKQIKQAIGGTVNDVLVSLVTASMRKYLAAHGASDVVDNPRTKFRCALPINTRPRGADLNQTFGNEFVLLNMRMPLDIQDPLTRLVEVKRLCDGMKMSPATVLTAMLNQLALAVLPTPWYVAATTWLLGKFSFMFTNVIGPSTRATIRGTQVVDMSFWVPTPCGNICCLLSYAGTCTLSVAAVPSLMPDTHGRFVDFFNAEFDNLYTLVVKDKKPLPKPSCGRREGNEFVLLLVLVAAAIAWAFWIVNIALYMLS